MKTVAFYTLGCKVNQYDSQAMLEKFVAAGYQPVPFEDAADVYVVTTCVVTQTGEKKSRQILRRAKRNNPGAELVAAGCLAQKDAHKLRGLGARLILGSQHRDQVVTLLEQAIKDDVQTVAVEDVRQLPFENLKISSQEGHTRAVMKIQEGCDRFCAYCIIPYVRGGIRSRGLSDIKEEAARLVAAGYQEIVLTGIHLSSFGRDLSGESLLDAIRLVADSGVARIRLGSLEPVIANEAFANELAKIPQICPQFHLSMQSGSDTVLKRMKRRYTAQEYLASARNLQVAFSDCALTTDVLTGFPGETETEFKETLSFCRQVCFARLHVFPFSRREGTPAYSMPGQLSQQVKNERASQLIALGEKLSTAYRQRFVGAIKEVLYERQEDGQAVGFTPEYIEVWAKDGLPGQIMKTRLGPLLGEGMTGNVVS